MACIVEGKTCAEVWERGIVYLLNEGEYVPSVRGAVIECVDVALVVTDPWEEPRISDKSPLFNQAGSFSASLRNHPRVINWEGVNQLERVTSILREDPLSRRAVITVWDPRQDLNRENPQGVVAFIFTIRRRALHLTSIFRTTDAWMCNWTLAGIPELQLAVRDRLRQDDADGLFDDLGVGTYTQVHSSFHMYLDEIKNAESKFSVL